MSDVWPAEGRFKRRALVYLMLSLVTACWMMGALWTSFGRAGPPPAITIPTLTLLTLVPLALSRWLRGLELSRKLRRGILLAALIFLSLLTISAGFYNEQGLLSDLGWSRPLSEEIASDITRLNWGTTLVLLLLCWRVGLSLGDMRLTTENLLRYFYLSVIILSAPTVLFFFSAGQDTSWIYFILFFFALMMLGLGRLEEVARRSQIQETTFTLYWLTQVGLFAGAVLGLTGAAHVLELARLLGLVTLLAAPLLALATAPLSFLSNLGDTSSGLETDVTPEGPDLDTDGGGALPPVVEIEEYEPFNTQMLCSSAALLAFVCCLVVAAVYSVRRWQAIAREVGTQERAALPSFSDFVTEALEERIERLSPRLPGMRRLRLRLATRSVRRIYAALVALGTERGHHRGAAYTPYEHLAALKLAFPGCEAQVEQNHGGLCARSLWTSARNQRRATRNQGRLGTRAPFCPPPGSSNVRDGRLTVEWTPELVRDGPQQVADSKMDSRTCSGWASTS
jgi:hypothetical protein